VAVPGAFLFLGLAEIFNMSRPLVSIIINNYNYGRFLGAAIDSVLTQDYVPKEVLITDDGSTDNSREVLDKYVGLVTPILKENGGQASALNSGVRASQGEILCFLDADDCFGAGKVARVVEAFLHLGLNSKPLLVHHRLQIIDAGGNLVDAQLIGRLHDSPLNLYPYAKRYKSLPYEGSPTSGLSVNRHLISRLFPIPEKGISTSADDFVVKGASVIGELYSLQDVLGSYRVHGKNLWHGSTGRKSPHFIRTLDEFLNQKLTENGLEPVLDFNESMYAWGHFIDDRKWAQLGKQMLKATIKQRDFHTTSHIFNTLRGMAVQALKPTLAKLKSDSRNQSTSNASSSYENGRQTGIHQQNPMK
jgi:glycosyltransferase involved in cell wall biosynthesis